MNLQTSGQKNTSKAMKIYFRTKMSHFCILFSFLIGIIETTNLNLEEPFYFPFGPDYNDTFNPKVPGACSSEQKFDYSFKFGPNFYSSLFVCNNGIIEFKTVNVTATIAPFVADVDTRDQFFDRMCFYPYQTYDDKFDIFAPSWTPFYEAACLAANTSAMFSINFYTNDYIVNEIVRNKTIDWEQRLFAGSTFHLNYDDYISRLVFGNETTKYVNLANNIFKRQLSLSDKVLCEELIRKKVANFIAEWGYVATWYKVGTLWYRIDAFNSFQVIIICGSVETVKRCFTLFDYFELQWNRWQSADSFSAAGFDDGSG